MRDFPFKQGVRLRYPFPERLERGLRNQLRLIRGLAWFALALPILTRAIALSEAIGRDAFWPGSSTLKATVFVAFVWLLLYLAYLAVRHQALGARDVLWQEGDELVIQRPDGEVWRFPLSSLRVLADGRAERVCAGTRSYRFERRF